MLEIKTVKTIDIFTMPMRMFRAEDLAAMDNHIFNSTDLSYKCLQLYCLLESYMETYKDCFLL